jgi:hypothetical protein
MSAAAIVGAPRQDKTAGQLGIRSFYLPARVAKFAFAEKLTQAGPLWQDNQSRCIGIFKTNVKTSTVRSRDEAGKIQPESVDS